MSADSRRKARRLHEYRTRIVRRQALHELDQCEGPEAAGRVASAVLRDERNEVVIVIGTSATLHVVGYVEVHRGGLNRCPVDIPEVLRAVLSMPTSGFFLAHNHPTGDPTPSADDWEITKKVEEAARVVGLTMLDHLVVGEGAVHSMRAAQTYDLEQTHLFALQR